VFGNCKPLTVRLAVLLRLFHLVLEGDCPEKDKERRSPCRDGIDGGFDLREERASEMKRDRKTDQAEASDEPHDFEKEQID
jgi:hypothetical protein